MPSTSHQRQSLAEMHASTPERGLAPERPVKLPIRACVAARSLDASAVLERTYLLTGVHSGVLALHASCLPQKAYQAELPLTTFMINI